MSTFVNTVDSVGDAALARSIIDRSITELHCNFTTSIREYAFRACAALTSINFPSVTSVSIGAFWQCTALTKAEFASTVSFANNAFYGCSALKALILRNTEAVSTITGTPFASSAIASGTGYIYVPSALVETYKTNWTAYAGQIRAIEDYPGVCDPYTWTGVAANIADGSYATTYKVGDTVPLDLGSEGLVNMQIVGIDVDDLADGSGKAPISWISEGLLKTIRRYNPPKSAETEGTGMLGGWEKSEMRTYLNDTIKPLIPSDVQAMIKTVTKYSKGCDVSGTIVKNAVTEDAVWIPSVAEMIGLSEYYESTGPQYNGYFVTAADRIKYNQSGSAWNWRLRTGSDSNNCGFITHQGGIGFDYAYNQYYIALGFCT